MNFEEISTSKTVENSRPPNTAPPNTDLACNMCSYPCAPKVKQLFFKTLLKETNFAVRRVREG